MNIKITNTGRYRMLITVAALVWNHPGHGWKMLQHCLGEVWFWEQTNDGKFFSFDTMTEYS